MLREGRGVTVSLTALTTLIVGMLSYGALKLWTDAGHEPPETSWLAVVLLVLLAIVVLLAGWEIRRYLRGESTRMPSPMRARRSLVAGQASALAGGAVLGGYLAQALILLPNADVDSVRADLLRALALAAGGVLLAVAGLLTQTMCRISHDDDPEDDGRHSVEPHSP